MAPPKKDAFADLFHSATGASQTSLNSNLNKLSLQEQLSSGKSNTTNGKQSNALPNWDFSSPIGGTTPLGSGTGTPLPLNNANAEFDPFSIFDPIPPVSKPAPAPMAVPITIAQPSGNSRSEMSLLDDDFEDAFTPEPTPPKRQEPAPSRQEPRPIQQQSQRILRPNLNLPSVTDTDARDTVLAGLIDIGFPVDVSNDAIDKAGPDLQACVNLIMNQGESQGSSGRRTESREQGPSLQGMSTDFLKRAAWLVEKSRKAVVKNIDQFQNPKLAETNGMPAWMRNQHKYRDDKISEGGSDYGTDEDNFNPDEIQRIIKLQKQREKERQRERLDRSGTSTPRQSATSQARPEVQKRNLARNTTPELPALVLGRASPLQRPELPTRPLLTPSVGETKAANPVPTPAPAPEVDLLGLGSTPLSRAQRFKSSASADGTYISPARRRAKAAPQARKATAEALNAFQQSDYEVYKSRGTESFTNGDFDNALNAYTKCLEALPPTHELRIVIWSNLAVTNIKLGNYKLAKQHCDEGIALVGDNIGDAAWIVNDKAIKYWYVKLLMRKAESLEMMESFGESLQCYLELISKHGVSEKKVMDAKRRVNNIVNPPKPQPKKAPKPLTPVNNALVQKIRQQSSDDKALEELKFKLHDRVHEKIQSWAVGKEDNLRALLMSLSDILPQKLGFPFTTDKKITINDLMLTKKVKINYMRVISYIHPDKLSKFEVEEQMICQGVFVALNKAWDAFKAQNNIA